MLEPGLLPLWDYTIAFTVALAISVFASQPLLHLLREAGSVTTNYRGREIVNCAGLLIPVVFTGALGIYAMFRPASPASIWPYLIMVFASAFFGLLDDLFGGGDSKGLRGHFRNLLEGRLTTGVLKALGIGAVAFIVAALRPAEASATSSLLSPIAAGGRIFAVLTDTAVIALSVNLMNLMDLRPGRALKVFITLDLGILIFAYSKNTVGAAVGLAAALVLIGHDLREKAMLGDVGSNALGAVIGTAFVLNFNWPARLAALALLLAIQLYAERHSITELISRVPALRRIDEWGRTE